MKIKYVKYHGCGNDFIIINQNDIKHEDLKLFAKKVCHRYTGIGSNGLMIIDTNSNIPYMHFYNQDGSIGTMCGNGLRCVSAYLLDEGYIKENKFEVMTKAGLMHVEVLSSKPYLFRVNLGKPSFDSKKLEIDTNKPIFLNEIISIYWY